MIAREDRGADREQKAPVRVCIRIGLVRGAEEQGAEQGAEQGGEQGAEQGESTHLFVSAPPAARAAHRHALGLRSPFGLAARLALLIRCTPRATEHRTRHSSRPTPQLQWTRAASPPSTSAS